MTTKTVTNAVARDEIYYPDSDGEPLGETGFHANVMYYIYGALKTRFIHRPDAYVIMDMFIYFVEGDPASVFAPDIAVVVGANGNHTRRIWQTWMENNVLPSFVLELVSQTTWRNDAGNKRDLYARLGVGEYWRHDPEGNLPVPALVGERLVNGRYEPIEVAADESGILRGYSPILGLDICVRPDGELKLYDPVTREWLRALHEEIIARRQAQAARRQAQADLQNAQANLQNAQADRRQAQADRRQETAARRQAQADRRQETAARRQAQADLQNAQAEIRRLRQLLGQRGEI